MCQEGQLEGGGLRVTFHRRGDRIQHEVWLLTEDASVPLLESDEGRPDEDWPVSPPFQALDVLNRSPDESLAYLVGKAGSSHWSMSVTLEPALRIVRFDVACRIQSSPEQLGSRYRCRQTSEVVDGGIRFTVESICARLIAEEIEGEAASTVLAQPVPDDDNGQQIDIQAPSSQANFPQTLRWRYLITVGD